MGGLVLCTMRAYSDTGNEPGTVPQQQYIHTTAGLPPFTRYHFSPVRASSARMLNSARLAGNCRDYYFFFCDVDSIGMRPPTFTLTLGEVYYRTLIILTRILLSIKIYCRRGLVSSMPAMLR